MRWKAPCELLLITSSSWNLRGIFVGRLCLQHQRSTIESNTHANVRSNGRTVRAKRDRYGGGGTKRAVAPSLSGTHIATMFLRVPIFTSWHRAEPLKMNVVNG